MAGPCDEVRRLPDVRDPAGLVSLGRGSHRDRDLDRPHWTEASQTRQTPAIALLILTLLVALGAGGLGGCGSPEPSVGRFERRFDELDRARWEETCGAYSEGDGALWSGGPQARRATFSNFSVNPMPMLESSCVASRPLDSPELSGVVLNLYTQSDARLVVERQPALVELLRPLVPERVWPCVIRTANSPDLTTCKAHGFRMLGGYTSFSRDRVAWSFEISVDRPVP